MKKVVVLAAALVCILPCWVFAQGFPGNAGSPWSAFSPTSSTELYNLVGFNLTGSAKIGHMKMGMNFNLPTFIPLFKLPSVTNGSIDVQLRGQWYWMGSVGLSSQITSNLCLSVYAEGNLKKNGNARTAENGLTISALPLTWEASKVQWWALDARAAYTVYRQYSILAGFRADHLSFTLRDPVIEGFGTPLSFSRSDTSGGLVTTLSREVTGDFLGKLWIPYVGLQLDGQYYRFALLWSPVAWASVKVPNRIASFFTENSPGNFFLSETETVDLRYALKKPGCFLEGQFEYDWNLTGPLAFQLWAKGSWLRIRGRGTMDLQLNSLNLQTFGGNSFVTRRNLANSDDARGTYTRYSIGGGISATWTF